MYPDRTVVPPNMRMNTKLLMSPSAALLASLGIGITFLPQEFLVHVGVWPAGPIVLVIQLLGALYLAAAILNWMNRGILIGGVYGRPGRCCLLIRSRPLLSSSLNLSRTFGGLAGC